MEAIKAGDLTKAEFDAMVRSPEFTELMRRFQSEPRPQPEKSGIDLYLDSVREAHSKEQLEAAESWVIRAFADMIRQKAQVKYIYFAEITSTKRTRKAGYTTVANEWDEIISLSAERLSLYYIDVILDDSYETDEEKIRAMIAKSVAELEKADNPLHDVYASHYQKAWQFVDGAKLKLWTHIVT